MRACANRYGESHSHFLHIAASQVGGPPEGISVGRTGARHVVKEVGEGEDVLKIDHDLCVVSIFGAG